MRTTGPLPAVDAGLSALRPNRKTGPGLRWLVLLTLAVLTVGTVLLIGLAVLRINQNNLEDQKVREGLALSGILAQSVVAGVDPVQPLAASSNRAHLSRLTAMRAHVRGVEQIVFYDTGLQVLAADPPTPAPALVAGVELASVIGSGEPYYRVERTHDGRELVVISPVVSAGAAPRGAVGIRMPLRDVDAKIAASRNLLMLYMVVDALVILLIGFLLMTRLVVRPLAEIVRGTHRVTLGDYSKPVRAGGAGEIGQLASDFNTMLRQLRAQRDALEGQVSRLEVANRELARAQESLIRSEKLATVGRLGAGMAHEVGNPLAAVIGYVELLREGDLDPEDQADLLDRVERELHRIDGILRDLLDYARADRDQALAAVDLRALVEGSVQLVEAQPRSRGVHFVVGAMDVPLVRAHEGRLHQVLVNLLLNAVDALDADGTVTVAASLRADGWIDLSVLDSGPGIAEDALPHIFEPFYTTKDPGTGTGLGLAICQSIIDGFGAEITAQNGPDGGARFTISVPPAV